VHVTLRLALVNLLVVSLAQAQPMPIQRWTITVDPVTELLGFVHVQVEHSLGKHFSIYAGPSLKVFDSPLGIAVGPFKGYGVEVGLRGFVWGNAPEGAWVMLRGVLAAVVSAQGTQPGGYASVLGGYTAILGPGLVLSGGLGVSYFEYGPSFGVHGFLPAAHTAIGWAF
jgi:hypothetical protein